MSICRYDSAGKCELCGHVAQSLPAFRNCPSLITGKHIFEQSTRLFRDAARDFGPGAELHAILNRFGLTASDACKCTSRAAYMDQMGCDWCEANIDEIVGWLREAAAERGLLFLDVAGRVLVRRAIANARRKEAARAKQAQAEGRAGAG